MAAIMTLAEQLEALIARIKDQVPGLKSVVGMEDLDAAMETDALLPAAVVIFAGDYPDKPESGLNTFAGQRLTRYWSVIVVLELTSGPGEAMALVEAVNKAGIGWQPCRGIRFLAAAGTRFITKFDATRVVYECRFATMTTV
ncbi:MAG: hypothetical protein KJ630_08120 [Proteobacteria bacterium]|nr:hypothetical protein [Pseudomonadota bacterium]